MKFQSKNAVTLLVVLLISAAGIAACSSPAETETPAVAPLPDAVEAVTELPEPETEAESLIKSDQNDIDEIETESQVSSAPVESMLAENPQFGISGGSEPESSSQVQQTQESAPALTVAPEIGAIAPNFTLQTVNGEEIKLHDLRGEAVMVNYWVTWCVPCIEEMPVLEKLHREYQQEGFTLLSVNGITQDDMNKVVNTLGQFNVTFPVMLDEGDSVYNDFQVRFMPTSFFIDQHGVIQHIQLGSTTEQGFRERIEQLLSDQL